MYPIVGVLEVGEVARPIGSYGLLAGLAIAVAGFVAIRAAWRSGEDVGLTFSGIALVVAFGFAGAWLTFGAVEWLRTGSPAAMWQGGGVVFFGAVPGGALGLAVTQRWLGLPAVKVLELALPGVAMAHALGRVGCFLGGCCFGRPAELAWAVTYTHPLSPAAHPSVPRHPSPLYEAAGLLVLALVFALRPPRTPGDGRRAAAYLIAYGALRIAVEGTRGDIVRGVIAGVSTSQIIAVSGIALALAFLGKRSRAGRAMLGDA